MPSDRRTPASATALALAALLSAAPAAAQNSLLDQGMKLLGGVAGQGGGTAAPAASVVTDGLKQALAIGIGAVVGQLGRTDGFNLDPTAHIPLPGSLSAVQGTLQRFGLGGLTGDLEVRLNRAAEQAVPKAGPLLLAAVRSMTLDDATRILKGPDDAATRYFETRMRTPLAAELAPIVTQELNQVGAVQLYDQAAAGLKGVPTVPDLKTDLTAYVTDRALAGVFHYLAQEEAAIRRDPARRTTNLLRQVFG